MSKFWDTHAIDPDRFRGHDQYLWQGPEYPYRQVVQFIADHGKRSWIERMGEDGAFGCVTWQVDGMTVSRDLLDSILEISFLDEVWPRKANSGILDIGAGYGRLAHRMQQIWPTADCAVYSTDRVAASLEVCDRYLRHRGLPVTVGPIQSAPFDATNLAINVHSWSECTEDEVEEWVERLGFECVPWLFTVPHDRHFSCEMVDGRATGEFRSIIERYYTVHATALDHPRCWPRNYYLWRLK